VCIGAVGRFGDASVFVMENCYLVMLFLMQFAKKFVEGL